MYGGVPLGIELFESDKAKTCRRPVTYGDLVELLSELEAIADEQEKVASRGRLFAEESKRCATVADAMRLAETLRARTFGVEHKELGSRASRRWAAFTSAVEAAHAEGSLDEAQILDLSGHLDSVRDKFVRSAEAFRRVDEAVQVSILDWKIRLGMA